jgi:hypothetical protein
MRFIAGCGLLLGASALFSGILAAAPAWFGEEPDTETLERANMRSCSWPTKDGDAFAPSSARHPKAAPTLVKEHISD